MKYATKTLPKQSISSFQPWTHLSERNWAKFPNHSGLISIKCPSSSLHDYELNDKLSLPSLNLIVVVDILHVLDQSGSMSFVELLRGLHTLHSNNALALYLDSLRGLDMISRDQIKCKEAIPKKSIFDIAENGKILLKVLEHTQNVLKRE